MLRKIIVTGMALGAGVVCAGNTNHYASSVKKPVIYDKDQAISGAPYNRFATGPYLGLSIGVQQNFLADPALYQAVSGTISGGYALFSGQQWYLAGEIFGTDNTSEKNLKGAVTGHNVQSNWSYGVDVIPGLKLTDYLIGYLRGGFIETRFNKLNVSKPGWQLGGGGLVNLNPNWDVRLEYIYSGYKTVTSVGKIGENQFNVGVVYKFA